ncbi:hypothetical protein Pst134EA_019041 [Puccinia striiformis f. sp. tritici]|uniref:hypothetical protein n=1 Tax=Puccinia striiformis f. sp. tritici TaxID=168172 RepID=UPI0020088321|nr:hypothetical protein Pst134EA_019041 [Puccinia striiformis f. sp. tritici]KAH9458887.1 hypothetical protein Pst134EA_019041 [Puccinia striiformis f. sp. tritici]
MEKDGTIFWGKKNKDVGKNVLSKQGGHLLILVQSPVELNLLTSPQFDSVICLIFEWCIEGNRFGRILPHITQFSLDLSKAKKDSGESTNGSIGEKKLGLQFLGQPDPKRYQRVEIVAEPEILSSLGKLLNEVVDFESVSEPRQAERKTSAHQDEDGEIVILTKPTNNTKPIDRKPPKRQPAPSTSHISTKTNRTSISSDLSEAEERYSETSQGWGPQNRGHETRRKTDRTVWTLKEEMVLVKSLIQSTCMSAGGTPIPARAWVAASQLFPVELDIPQTKQQCLDHFDVMRQKLKEILRLIKHYIAAWNDLAHQAILPASQWQLIKRGNESELKRWSDKHSSTVELFCEWYCKSLRLPQVQHHHEQEGLKWGIGPRA